MINIKIRRQRQKRINIYNHTLQKEVPLCFPPVTSYLVDNQFEFEFLFLKSDHASKQTFGFNLTVKLPMLSFPVLKLRAEDLRQLVDWSPLDLNGNIWVRRTRKTRARNSQPVPINISVYKRKKGNIHTRPK